MKALSLSRLVVLSLIILSISSCNKEQQAQFTLEGVVADADSTMLYFEKRSLTDITLLDSVRLDAEGKFKFAETAPQYGEFYLLKLANQSINIAVDSVETITINASKSGFATKFTVNGSENTAKIKEITLAQNRLSSIMKSLTKDLQAKTVSQDDYVTQVQNAIDEYKVLATNVVRSDYTSLAAYFAIFQKVGGLLIFDPYEKTDRVLFQATATGWEHVRPGSERSIQLKQFVLGILANVRNEAKLSKRLEESTKEVNSADISDYYNISLPDITGKTVELASLKGKVTILDFTSHQTEHSPAHNIKLNRVYEKYKANIEIYQVSFDSDEHLWRNAAANLPWISVRDSHSGNSKLMQTFNVQGLPTTFLIGENGNLLQRILPSDDIEAALKKVL